MPRLMEVPEPATDSARSKAHPSRSVARRRMLQMVKPRRTPQPAFDLGETSQTCRGPRLLLPKCPPRRPLTASTARPLLAPSACCPSPSVPEDTDPTQGTYDDVVIHSSRQPVVRGNASIRRTEGSAPFDYHWAALDHEASSFARRAWRICAAVWVCARRSRGRSFAARPSFLYARVGRGVHRLPEDLSAR